MNRTNRLKSQSPLDSTPSGVESPVRPKIMRRPAAFSGSIGAASMPQIHLPPVALSEESENENLALMVPELDSFSAPPAKPWQDDLRFGVVLLCLVVATNLALMLWLSHLRQTPPSAISHEVQAPLATSPTAPQPPLTFYAKPEPRALLHEQAAPATVFAPMGTADSGPEQ